MTATAAWRKANATMACYSGGSYDPRCPALRLVEDAVFFEVATHDACASLFLDGFTVEEVTEAE